MSQDFAWEFGRRPYYGEDIYAWAREEISGALAWATGECLLVVATTDERGNAIPEPMIRFLLPDARVGDPYAEKPLAEAIEDEIDANLSPDEVFDADGLARMRRLRDVLRENADWLDEILARSVMANGEGAADAGLNP